MKEFKVWVVIGYRGRSRNRVVGRLESSLHLVEDGAGELVSGGIATHVAGAGFTAVSG